MHAEITLHFFTGWHLQNSWKVGKVTEKQLSQKPHLLSEQDIRLGLRSGIILCNVLNKVKPGAVPKVYIVCLFFPCSNSLSHIICKNR